MDLFSSTECMDDSSCFWETNPKIRDDRMELFQSQERRETSFFFGAQCLEKPSNEHQYLEKSLERCASNHSLTKILERVSDPFHLNEKQENIEINHPKQKEEYIYKEIRSQDLSYNSNEEYDNYLDASKSEIGTKEERESQLISIPIKLASKHILATQKEEESLPNDIFVIEGGIIVDLSEFQKPESITSADECLRQVSTIHQIQQFKKFAICQLEFKQNCQKTVTEIIGMVDQITDNLESVQALKSSLQNYKQFLNKLSNQEKLNEDSMQPQPNLPPLNYKQIEKLLSQFEKYAFTFRIFRKRKARVESNVIGVSNSFIELLGLEKNTAISQAMRKGHFFPWDSAGCNPSQIASEDIQALTTILRVRQKLYSRRQGVRFGQITQSTGSEIKVKVQSRAFMISQSSEGGEYGDFLEIKVFSPENYQIQGNTHQKKKNTRTSQKDNQNNSCNTEAKSASDILCEINHNCKNTNICSQNKYSEISYNFIQKFYTNQTMLSPELIFRKKWVKREQWN